MAFIVVNPALRSSNALAFPVNGLTVPANANVASVNFTMPVDAERASTSARLDFDIQVSTNAGATWKSYLRAGWAGGTGATDKNSTVLNPPPRATLGGDFFAAFAGHLARVGVKLSEPMTLGGTISSTRI
jgi:hypothetical protein